MDCIVPDTGYYQCQKQPLWVADKRVELYGIRIDAGDIALTIQWYDQITGISVSDMVYRLYWENNPHVQIHTQLVHVDISTNQMTGTTERHTSARNKSVTITVASWKQPIVENKW